MFCARQMGALGRDQTGGTGWIAAAPRAYSAGADRPKLTRCVARNYRMSHLVLCGGRTRPRCGGALHPLSMAHRPFGELVPEDLASCAPRRLFERDGLYKSWTLVGRQMLAAMLHRAEVP